MLRALILLLLADIVFFFFPPLRFVPLHDSVINIACCQIADVVMQPDPAFKFPFFFFFGCVFLNLHNMSFSVCIKGCAKQGRGKEEGKKKREEKAN